MESSLEKITKMGRATGICVILSILRPVGTVISSAIKANMFGRISFRVPSPNDSRNILGQSGAEKLQRPGDMIFSDGISFIKGRCAYMELSEVERINDYIRNQQGYLSAYELPDPNDEESLWPFQQNDIDMQHLDPLFEDAARLIVREQSGSTSLVQRKFAIGYNRCGRMLDQMEKAGIVGPYKGSKPREVLIKDEYSLNLILNKYR
jgi:S-DNA-T family DNA segregation ATPase FtsK/SpoIIIE